MIRELSEEVGIPIEESASNLKKVEEFIPMNFEIIGKISEIVIECNKKLQANCNIISVIENLLLKILEVKYLCRK